MTPPPLPSTGVDRRLVLAGLSLSAARPAFATVEATGGFALPRQAPAQGGHIDVGGARLWYWDTGGNGAPVMLLHPATGSAAIWGYQQPAFAAAGYRVIAYSRRGHFRSSVTADDLAARSIDDLRRVADALALDRFHLLGLAAGGFICPDFALSHPDRLLSMIVACSRGGAADPAFTARLAATTPAGFADMPASFRELGPSYRMANPAGVAAWEALEHYAQVGTRARQGTANRIDWPSLESIRVPSLVIAGAADLYMPPAAAREFASHLRGSEIAILPESGHSGYWEEPDRFNATVLGFLARHRGRSRSRRG